MAWRGGVAGTFIGTSVSVVLVGTAVDEAGPAGAAGAEPSAFEVVGGAGTGCVAATDREGLELAAEPATELPPLAVVFGT